MKSVLIAGQPVHFRPQEYDILELLVINAGTLTSKEQLSSHLYRGRREGNIRSIDVVLSRVRTKIAKATGENYIHNVFGRGFCLKAPEGAE